VDTSGDGSLPNGTPTLSPKPASGYSPKPHTPKIHRKSQSFSVGDKIRKESLSVGDRVRITKPGSKMGMEVSTL
jgi:hypothetical protein